MRRRIALLSLVFLINLIYPTTVTKSEALQNIPNPTTNNEEEYVLKPDLVTAQLLYEEWQLKQELRERADKLVGTHQGQCVVAARNFLRVSRDEISGVAKNLETNSIEPQIGAIIKLKESSKGHVGVVIDMDGDNLLVFESNYSYNERASLRWISKYYPRIEGYKIINIE